MDTGESVLKKLFCRLLNDLSFQVIATFISGIATDSPVSILSEFTHSV